MPLTWFQQNYQFVVATVIGIVAIILAWWQLTKKTHDPPADKVVNQTAHGHGLIGQIGMARDIHIHVPSMPDVQPNANAIQRRRPITEKPVAQPKPNERPRLETLTEIRAYNAEELRNRLDTAPHIDLIFNLPRTNKPVSVLRSEEMKVVNTKISYAYNVQIQPMESDKYKATFKAIPRLGKDQEVYAEMDLRIKPGGTYFKYFEKLLKLESDQPSEEQEFEVKVPLVVRFRDSKNDLLYETKHEAVYNIFSREAYIRLVEGTTIVRET
jgi:hypothetical protein